MPESFVWLALSIGECEKIIEVAGESDWGGSIVEILGLAVEEGPHLSADEVQVAEIAGLDAIGRGGDGVPQVGECPHCGSRDIRGDVRKELSGEVACRQCSWEGFATLLTVAPETPKERP